MKYKRPLAIAAVIILLLLYTSTIVFALMDSPLSQSLLLTSLFCTIVVPAVLYGYIIIIKGMKEKSEKQIKEKKEETQ